MSLSLFNDKTHPPSKPEIMDALGKCYSQWIDLVQYFHDHVSPVTETWKNYGKSSGWTLLLKHNDRTIIYLFPNKRFFTVLFVYGEKACQRCQRRLNCRMKYCSAYCMRNPMKKAGRFR